ncbi:hypothetical protein QYE76_018812 [Lolium multiflorum]|uniref:BZIP domain-containing protein n=1 Tax=Lolium multiflorum TaxID=4521 RepID=A0AAD8QGG0_LOLMU|nr:hypothetical protein QYE76_018812 [Lolium multiflorum]
MDDGDSTSNPEAYLCLSLGADVAPGGCSMDSHFDDILKDTEHLACTHTHTCNPPAHDLSHTHTCVHVHTKVVSASSDGAESPSAASKKRRPSGNRAAVRKYREKKKAHTALLEEEVVHLKALNKQLMRKVQTHAALEAEVARLRCLLVDIRGRIEGEIGAFPYGRKSAVDLVPGGGVDLAGGAAAQVMNSCDFRCNDQLYCNPGQMQMRTMGDDAAAMGGQVFGQGSGDFSNAQCMGTAKSGSAMPPGCGGMGTMPSGCLPNSERN